MAVPLHLPVHRLMADLHGEERLSVGALREALIDVMELGGAWGGNMHESKEVLLRTPDGSLLPLVSVSAAFVEGRFVLVLDGGQSGRTPGGSDG